MEIVDATWEKRNIGLETVEITIGKGDTVEEIESAIKENEAEYTVVKVPSPMPEAAMKVQEMGYGFIECLISLRRSTELPDLKEQQKKLMEGMDYELMGEADYERLYEEIHKGMFDTGRLSMDPFFTQEQADKRYAGWVKDEIERGTELFKFMYKGEDAGFFGFKKVREGVFFPFLAGLYPGGPRVIGMGYGLCYMEIKEANRRGARTILGSVSSNNVPSLATLTSYGYIADGIVSVYVKH